jgi:hypothetical protein
MKLFILIFCLVISFGAFWYGVKLIKLYLRVKKWERIKATILQKSVVKRKQAAASRAGYKPDIDYTYTYNSKIYKGNKIFLVELINGERGFLQHAAEKWLKKIEPEVEIYVDPHNPEQAVMFCEGINLYIFVLVMGLTSLFIGLLNFH